MIKIVLIKLINFYQKLSKLRPPVCRFYPTCSEYTKQAILKYGVSIGTVTDNLKSTVKYGVEQFTGMIVDSVNINVVGVRV